MIPTRIFYLLSIVYQQQLIYKATDLVNKKTTTEEQRGLRPQGFIPLKKE